MKQEIKVAVTMLVLGCAALAAVAGQIRQTIDTDKHEWVMNHSDDGRVFHLRIKGQPEFADDYSDIKSLAPGGSVSIEEKTASMVRKLEITAADDGQLQRKYF